MATVQESATTEKQNAGGQTVTVQPSGQTVQNVGARTSTQEETTPEHTVSQSSTVPSHVVTQEQKSHSGLTATFRIRLRRSEPVEPAAEGSSISAGPDCP